MQVADDVTLICPGRNLSLEQFIWERSHVIETGFRLRTIVWENLVLPRFIGDHNILFCPSYFVPIRCGIPKVVAIHDVTHEIFPKSVPWYWLWRLRWGIGYSVRRAAFVITVSEASKKDICKYYGADPRRVVVTHLAASPLFQMMDRTLARQAVRIQLGIEHPYILYVGSIMPRRNIPRLIQAFSEAKGLSGHQLVIAGRNFQRIDIADICRQFGCSNRVRHISAPSDEQLVNLYNGADTFVYPSSYEGFGLPVLEAMACGVPVITGNNSSLKEIAGDAAYLVDVGSTKTIAEALRELTENDDYRRKFSGRGLERAKLFSWEKTASETLSILRTAAGLTA